MTVLQDLLKFTPEYWDTDPQGVPVIKVTYAGTACWVKIEDDTMELVPQGGVGTRHIIYLDSMFTDPLTKIPYQMRLGDLVDQINSYASEGFSAELVEENFFYFTDGTQHPPDLNNIWRQRPIIYTNVPLPAHTPPLTEAVLDKTSPDFPTMGWYLNEPAAGRPIMIPGFGNGMADIAAAVLVDGLYNIVENNSLSGVTNLIWQLLKPIARTLRKAQDYGHTLTRQIDLRSVEGPWLDRWGAVYGIKRIYPETDGDFRRRLSATVLQPRISPTSLERAIQYGLSFLDVQVVDVAGTPFKFKVIATAPPTRSFYIYPAVQNIIEAYRAAGTRYEFDGVVRHKEEEIVPPHWAVRMNITYTDGRTELWYGGNAIPDGVLTPWRKIFAGNFVTGPEVSLFGGDVIGGELFG